MTILGHNGVLENTYTVDNGAKPHEAHYLTKKTVTVAVVLGTG